MDGGRQADHEWELSKENVQPLRQGRQMSSLTQALQLSMSETDPDSKQNLRARQQQAFEQELREPGDDPFDVWDRYIKWAEQHFPRGHHDGHVSTLIERCIREFQSNEQYKNDPRFIDVWIKFTASSSVPSELFAYMFDNGIGITVAALYIEWAASLEHKGDYKQADTIYTEGLNRCAQPRSLLLQRKQQFEHRVARNICLKVGETEEMEESTEEERKALARLKVSKRKVGVARTGSALKGSAGVLQDSRSKPVSQIPSKGLSIYKDDENVPPSIQPTQSYEWKSLPTKVTDNRENDKKPGKWTEARAKQRPGTVPSVPSAPAFQIHEDPDAQLQTPRKTTLINTQPLSSRKIAPPQDALRNLQKPTEPLIEIPMYPKNKVYNGLQEFSLEEIRAIQYRKRKEAQAKEEEERLKREQMEKIVKETNQKMEAITSLLQPLIQGLNLNNVPAGQDLLQVLQQQQQLQLLQQQPPPPQQQQQQPPPPQQQQQQPPPPQQQQQQPTLALQQQQLPPVAPLQQHQQQQDHHQPPQPKQSQEANCVSEGSVKDEEVAMEMGENQADMITPTDSLRALSMHQGQSSGSAGSQSSANNSLRTPIFNSAASYSVTSSGGLNSSSSCGAMANVSMRRAQFASSSGNSSQMFGSQSKQKLQSSTTPQNFDLSSQSSCSSQRKQVQTPKSNEHTLDNSSLFNRKAPLCAPSPTVMTKEAMHVVHQMFSDSFEQDTTFGITQEVTAPKATAQVPPTGRGLAFQICEDTTGQMTSAPKGQGLQVYQDPKAVKLETSGMANIADQENVPSVRKSTAKKGLQIYCDEPMQAETTTVKKKGLQIHCDEPETKIDEVKPLSMKKSARRGLGFAPSGAAAADEEMPEVDDQLNVPGDFTMIHQARDDMTLAPLDSFRIHAMTASTPFNSGHYEREIAEDNDAEMQSPAPKKNCTTDSTMDENGSDSIKSPGYHLSPILEGSGEGSAEDTKSTTHQSSHASISNNVTLRSRHGSQRSSVSQQEPIPEAEDGDWDSSMLDPNPLDASCHHEVDTTTYIPKPSSGHSEGPMPGQYNPFDDDLIEHLLSQLEPPVSSLPNFHQYKTSAPELERTGFARIGENFITVEECLGEGGYAKVYRFIEHCVDLGNTMTSLNKVLKVQSPPCYWEFYVVHELRKRLSQQQALHDMTTYIVDIEQGFFYQDASLIQMPHIEHGSLLNLVNLYKNDRNLLTTVEPFACVLAIQLLGLFEEIHKAGFIHADVKPDNFLLNPLSILPVPLKPKQLFSTPLVQLIDFGQAIDLNMFPEGTSFTAKVRTSGFQCIEMKLDKPWTFQPDLFGIAGTLHVVLFGFYMKIYQENSQWKVTGNYVRKWNIPLWKKFFYLMLNVPSCDRIPNLAELRAEFVDYFISENLCKTYNSWVKEIRSHLEQ